ncbi:MAG: DUF1439 domain-containing protein, partial [Verrucomicrobiota bacterium]
MLKHVFRLSLILVVLCSLFACSGGLEFAIPKSQLDPRIKAKFPVSKGTLLRVTLSNPELEYLDAKDRLQVDVEVAARVIGLLPTAKGQAQVEGGLGYIKENRTIIMTDVEVKKLNIDGLPEGKHEELLALVGQAIRPVLTELELYQFDSNSRLENLAGAYLKGFRVEKDK